MSIELPFAIRQQAEKALRYKFDQEVQKLVAELKQCAVCWHACTNTGIELTREGNTVVVFFHGASQRACAALLETKHLTIDFVNDYALVVCWSVKEGDTFGEKEHKDYEERKARQARKEALAKK